MAARRWPQARSTMLCGIRRVEWGGQCSGEGSWPDPQIKLHGGGANRQSVGRQVSSGRDRSSDYGGVVVRCRSLSFTIIRVAQWCRAKARAPRSATSPLLRLPRHNWPFLPWWSSSYTLLVFINAHRKFRKRIDTVIAFTQKCSQVSYLSTGKQWLKRFIIHHHVSTNLIHQLD
jgi:hypothetical protein